MDAKNVIKMFEGRGFRSRHGDVVLVADAEAEAGRKLPPVLAEGEATGHAHRIVFARGKSTAEVYRVAKETVQRLLRVTAEKAQVDHEEHTQQDMPKGRYRVGILAQWTPTGLRPVVD